MQRNRWTTVCNCGAAECSCKLRRSIRDQGEWPANKSLCSVQLPIFKTSKSMRFHTEAIMTGRRPSKWLENYRNPKGDLVMSYIEDEGD
ncbi:hypothetical protein SRHO_G00342270, partial [Serrasalmus rhombeus]